MVVELEAYAASLEASAVVRYRYKVGRDADGSRSLDPGAEEGEPRRPSHQGLRLLREDATKSTVFSQEHIGEKRELFRNLHASLQPSHDDFLEFQAWVREVFEKNGSILVPESCSKEELQEEISDLWAQFKEEYARDHPDDSDTETDEE
jgi:hypothetical protein